MQKILLPTDFSENAQHAFQYAQGIAEKLNATIDVVHVYKVTFSDVSAYPEQYIEQQISEKRSAVDDELQDFIKDANPDLIGKVRAVYGVFAAMEIMDYAGRKKYDCIIMGTKGRRNPLDRLIGSITSTVVMKAPCPVIAVPEAAPIKMPRSIALATSFDQPDQEAAKQLHTFAEQTGATIHLVHVNTKSDDHSFQEVVDDRLSNSPFQQFTIVYNQSVIKGLDSFVEQFDIDILALYIPNRRLWERIFHQSVSKRMTLHTKVPLIVYRE